MNFNFALIILMASVLGCGLKTRPVPPAGTALPSIIDQYKYKVVPKGEESKKK